MRFLTEDFLCLFSNKEFLLCELYEITESIGEYGVKHLGEGISKCVTLTSLHLNFNNNRIGENGAKYLGEGISKCGHLTCLNLNLFGTIFGED